MKRLLFPLLLMLPLAGCGHPPPGSDAASSPVPSVHAVVVRRGTIENTIAVTGTLLPPMDRRATISPPVSGVLADLDVHLGESVRRGEVVARLRTETVDGQIQQAQATLSQNQVMVHQAKATALQQQAQAQSAVMQAEAAVSNAQAALTSAQATLRADQATLENAQNNLDRLSKLSQDGLVATKDVQAAQVAVKQARAQVASQQGTVESARLSVESRREALKAAQAGLLVAQAKRQDVAIARDQVRNAQGALQTAEGQRALYTLRSPLDGQVIAVGASTGETVDSTTKVVSVADLHVLELNASVPAGSRDDVHVGDPVRIFADDLAKPVTASLTFIGTVVDPTSDTITVRTEMRNPSLMIPNGSYARAEIVVAQKKAALVVPHEALLDLHGNQAAVMVIGKDDVAHRVPVTLGLQTDRQAEVVNGLHDGDRVGTVGAYGLPDGTVVRVGP
ncbi:MAG: efflux RND transporter periplasmic adaptor subunit [Candidatus Xenobia bacterium]